MTFHAREVWKANESRDRPSGLSGPFGLGAQWAGRPEVGPNETAWYEADVQVAYATIVDEEAKLSEEFIGNKNEGFDEG